MPDASAAPTMPNGWLDAPALAALCRVSISQARRYLATWERAPVAPRTQRLRRPGQRGQPPLIALRDDVLVHLALDDDHAHEAQTAEAA